MTKRRVLIVDDELFFLEPLNYRLVSEGFDVAAVRTPTECLNYLQKEGEPDAIILDIMLPWADSDLVSMESGRDTGLLLLKKIREDHPTLPILLMSVRMDVQESIPKHGATTFMSKGSADMSEIVQGLQALIRGRPTKRPTKASRRRRNRRA